MIRFLQTPGPIKKIILGGMLLLICAAMLIYLVPTGSSTGFSFGGLQPGVVVQVEGEQVTSQEVNRQVDRMVRQQLPRGTDASMFRRYFSSQAVQDLINQKILLAEAHRLGLRATDEEVRDEVQHGKYASYFAPGGKFIGQQEYETFLGNNNLTPEVFEASVKQEILLDKLRDLVTGGATVTDLEIRREFAQRNAKVKFDYAVLTRDNILKSIHPSEAELKAYYEQHKANYENSIPEKRKVKYALIDSSKLGAQAQVTPDELRAYYDEHRDDYRVAGQVNVRQILIKAPLPGPDGKVDAKAAEEAKKKAEDVLRQLKAGGQFADLAKKYSEDPSSKNGGSVGWVQAGQFPAPSVDKAAFTLPKGGTSDVIDAGYAFVILHVDDKQDAHVKTLDEVKAQIEPTLRQQKATQKADSQARALLATAHASGLDKAAMAAGVQVITTDFVGRNDSLPGIGNSPQFMASVFNAAEKSPPDEVQLAQGFAVFELLAVQPPATPTFDAIRSRVEDEFKNERASTLLSQKTQELSDRAKAEHDLNKAARELGATVKTSDFVAPDGQVPDVGSMSGSASVAFTMKPGDISGPVSNGTDGAVLKLVDRQEPSAQDFAAKQDEIRDSILLNKQGELFAVFLSNLRDQMQKAGKIKINQDEMKKLTGGPSGEEGG